jgi:hypothetical protein
VVIILVVFMGLKGKRVLDLTNNFFWLLETYYSNFGAMPYIYFRCLLP